jgi:hypothetical protein
MEAKAKVKKVTIEAIVFRKDGKVENLGVIASTKKGNIFTNLLRR